MRIAGLALALAGVLGESVADLQMQAFKRDPESRGRVCEVGVWRYSRHPNYFFESLVWCGFFVAALGSPYGWITIVCPLRALRAIAKRGEFVLLDAGAETEVEHAAGAR